MILLVLLLLNTSEVREVDMVLWQTAEV